MSIIINKEYSDWLKDLKLRYKQGQIKAAVKVNSEMLKFYWSLGRDIVLKNAESKFGDKFYKNLSTDLQESIPDAHCFSETNLRYMKYFYATYCKFISYTNNIYALKDNYNKKVHPQLGDEIDDSDICPIFLIPWGHQKYILDKYKNAPKVALFYVNKTIENGWSRAALLNCIDSKLHERYGKAITNFSTALPKIEGELAQQITKDPYNFDFLSISERFNEKELKDALIENITKFLMELGTGFAFMGREYRLQVNTKEQFIDLLFYNTKIHCYVVCEVKVTEFEPSYLGQLSGYVSFVNNILKSESDNPTIGLLICKNKDNVFAQYSLEGYNQPIGISEFSGINFMPENFSSTLPTIEEIEAKLNK